MNKLQPIGYRQYAQALQIDPAAIASLVGSRSGHNEFSFKPEQLAMRRLPQNRIQPKISTMPRQRSEAAAFLEIYKLVVEKRRLQQELENMEQRKQQIFHRLAMLDAQVADLETTAQEMRQAIDRVSPDLKPESRKPKGDRVLPKDDDFETFFLEY